MHETYWRGILKDFSTPTGMVVGNPLRPTGDTGYQCLGDIQVPSTAVALAAWGLLLARYNDTQDVVFGVGQTENPTGGSVGDTVGHSTGTTELFPLRVAPQRTLTTEEYVAKVADAYKNALDHPTDLASAQSLSEVSLDRPLFESAVVFDERRLELPLVLHVRGTSVELRYDAALFEEGTIGRLCGHLDTLVKGLSAGGPGTIDQIDLLTPQERHQILDEWNQTEVDFPHDACLHNLLEANALSQPEATAVIFRGETLSYGELDRRANQLAHYLRSKGVGPDVPVAVFVERSLEMVVGLYGVHKAGGCYVPVDPAYPQDRVAFMIADSEAVVVLTQAPLLERVDPILPAKSQVVQMDQDWPAISAEPEHAPATSVTSDSLAYIIYTSGSTGRPKGAMLNHQGRVNNFLDFNRRYNIGPDDTVLGISSLSFDMSAYDVFGTLAAGATLVVVPGDDRLEPGRWAAAMVRHGVTIWHSVPALLEMMVTHIEARPDLIPKDLRLTLLGGDWIPVTLPDRMRQLVPSVHNVSMGGATECSMDSTIYDITKPSATWKSIPYGVPMANQQCYVLDSAMDPVPIGVPGELFLGGIGVGRGYLNRPDLTAERFINSPGYLANATKRLYRTGDLARFQLDGNLELLGRVDFQVKIRGHRIELGEIEAELRKHAAVKESVVLAREDEGQTKRLVAYLMADPTYTAPQEVLETWTQETVTAWSGIYDAAYASDQTDRSDGFSIISWDSSYTGEPIPAQDMRQWVDSTVARIQVHDPRRIWEIGCGTGLLLSRLAPKCETYLGTDLAGEALSSIQRNIGTLGGIVRLEQRVADDSEGIEPDSFDAVVINSVVMNFPSVDYLMSVLRKAVEAVESGGIVFVGDVRSLPLLEMFHTSVQFHRSSDPSVEGLKRTITERMQKDNELVLHPDFFKALKQWIPNISHVETHLKRGSYDNEVSRFRYDVTLHVNKSNQAAEAVSEVPWRDWQDLDTDPEELPELLKKEHPTGLGIRDIPNAVLHPFLAQLNGLRQNDPDLNQLGNATAEFSIGAVDPSVLWALWDRYEVNVQCSNTPGFMEAVILPLSEVRPRFPSWGEVDPALKPTDLANKPLWNRLRGQIVSEVRSRLASSLPDYMVPSAFVLLDEFPLTPNGKLNRSALPVPSSVRPEMEQDFTVPSGPIEEVLVTIWQGTLGLSQVGVSDPFVALGGHSLAATEVMSRIRDIFQVELPLSYGFNATITELGSMLEKESKNVGIQASEVAQTFLQISLMSDEEIEAMLAQGDI